MKKIIFAIFVGICCVAHGAGVDSMGYGVVQTSGCTAFIDQNHKGYSAAQKLIANEDLYNGILLCFNPATNGTSTLVKVNCDENNLVFATKRKNKFYKCDYTSNNGKGGWVEQDLKRVGTCSGSNGLDKVKTLSYNSACYEVYGKATNGTFENNQQYYGTYSNVCVKKINCSRKKSEDEEDETACEKVGGQWANVMGKFTCICPNANDEWDAAQKKCVTPVTPETVESDCVAAGGTWKDGVCICSDPSHRYSAVSKRCLRECDYYAENPSEAPSGRLDCCKVPSSVAKWQDDACVCNNGQTWNFNASDPNSSCGETGIDYTDDYDDGGGAVAPGTEIIDDLCPAAKGLKLGVNGCECLNFEYTEQVKDGQGQLLECIKPRTGGDSNEEINIVYKNECDKLVEEGVAKWENSVCNCVDTTKRYDADQNACVPRCNEAVATWDGTQCKCNQENYIYANDNCTENPQVVAQRLNERQAAYDAAKENEQSLANRSLGALSTAATGLGMKEAFQGYAEKKADAAAADDMAAYIETMRCTYGDGKSVKAGNTPVELPGGNDEAMMSLRSEYLALAASLKERKESLGMKAGIESELVLDKATMGLYDQENTGITGGAYSSLYRANMLSSEKDQSKIDKDADKSDKRLKIGATVAGVGIVGGIVANNIINGDNAKNDQVGTETKRLLAKEADALDDLKQCLSDAGVKNTDGLMFENFFPSVFSVNRIDCKQDLYFLRDEDASNLFADSTSETVIYDKLVSSGFSKATISKMVGSGTSADQIKKKIKSSIETTRGKFKDATAKDKKSAESLGLIFNEISNNGDGLKDLSAMFSGFGSGSQFDLSQYSQSN